MMLDTSYNSKSPLYASLHKSLPYKSALAERLAKLRAQAAAEQRAADAAAAQSPDSDRKIPSAHPADSIKRTRLPRPPVKKDSSDTTGGSGKPADTDKPLPKDSTP
jgi:septal ring factor EnvC (AmiA/AmiB activator)